MSKQQSGRSVEGAAQVAIWDKDRLAALPSGEALFESQEWCDATRDLWSGFALTFANVDEFDDWMARPAKAERLRPRAEAEALLRKFDRWDVRDRRFAEANDRERASMERERLEPTRIPDYPGHPSRRRK